MFIINFNLRRRLWVDMGGVFGVLGGEGLGEIFWME